MGSSSADVSTELPDGTTAERCRPLPLPVGPVAILRLVMHSLMPFVSEAAQPPDCVGTEAVRHGAGPIPRYTRREAAERVGLMDEDLARLCQALGFAEVEEEQAGYTAADLEAFGKVARLITDGVIDLDMLVSMVRPIGHLLSRLGAAQASALAGLEARPRTGDGQLPGTTTPRVGAESLVPLLEQLVVYAWHRHLADAVSAALPIGALEAGSAPQAVGFIDIADYTATSRRIDWTELARLLERFEGCVFGKVVTCGGRVVKTLGDEVLFVADDPAAAAEIALSVIAASRISPDVPAVHAGLAYGRLLERAGDVFGPTVNVASRVTDLARAGSVLVDEAFRIQLQGDPRFATRRRRPRRPVRGYPHLRTYRLQRAVLQASDQ